MRPTIEASNLSKSYQIQANRPRYLSLRESLSGFYLFKRKKHEILWALKDFSFKANPGESIGIIGKNGAGKSTLLKVLSRITPPTMGKATVRGRMASLLEVGTGFHPELTGRENIFLNGSLMGLKRFEIKRQFDDIADFSGVEKFLETPLKHYSSGMQLRLAFAVAAFLEPEILLLDEVLAVGDAEFQKKGLQKMDEVAKSGKTVLLISHNMAAVRQLCSKGIVIEQGLKVFEGKVNQAIDHYLEKVKSSGSAVWENDVDPNDFPCFLSKIAISDTLGNPKNEFLSSETIKLSFHLKSKVDFSRFTIGFDLLRNGIHLFRSRQIDGLVSSDIAKNREHIYSCEIPGWFLHEGSYAVRPFVAIHFISYLSNVHDMVELPIEIQTDPSRTMLHGNLNLDTQPGLIFPMLKWKMN